MNTPKNKSFTQRLKAGLRRAFSLVELLVVIAVIGVIAAIAIPNISNITGQAGIARDQRNAQNIASVSASARAAGYNFTAGTGTAAVAALIVGVPGADSLSGATFKLDMDPADYTTAVKSYLTYSATDGFSYDKTGNGDAD
jgi:prepilin-type N-terminal cleavage/methylation domain-containing protein